MDPEQIEEPAPQPSHGLKQSMGSIRFTLEPPPEVDSKWCGGPGGHDVFVERIDDV
jgi:hypothetical protein